MPLVAGNPQENRNLPDVVDIAIRRVPFTARRYKHFRSALARHKEAVEFMVRLSGPVPIRALGPALFVGDVSVSEAEAVEDKLYRFLAFDIARLKAGAPITFGWNNASESQRKDTGFRFDLPKPQPAR
jgi:hypothetical protein